MTWDDDDFGFDDGLSEEERNEYDRKNKKRKARSEHLPGKVVHFSQRTNPDVKKTLLTSIYGRIQKLFRRMV